MQELVLQYWARAIYWSRIAHLFPPVPFPGALAQSSVIYH